jgi:hypothetical protein
MTRMIFVSSLPTQRRLIPPGASTTLKQKESRPGVWTASQRPPPQSSSTRLIGISRSTVMIILQTPRRGRTLLNRKPRKVGPNQFYQILSPILSLVGGRLVQPPPQAPPLLSRRPPRSRKMSQKPFNPMAAYPVARTAWVNFLRARTWLDSCSH